jgi:hypothetical protein
MCISAYYASSAAFNNSLVAYLIALILCGAFGMALMVGLALVYRRYRRHCCNSSPSSPDAGAAKARRTVRLRHFTVSETSSDDDVYDEQDEYLNEEDYGL